MMISKLSNCSIIHTLRMLTAALPVWEFCTVSRVLINKPCLLLQWNGTFSKCDQKTTEKNLRILQSFQVNTWLNSDKCTPLSLLSHSSKIVGIANCKKNIYCRRFLKALMKNSNTLTHLTTRREKRTSFYLSLYWNEN